MPRYAVHTHCIACRSVGHGQVFFYCLPETEASSTSTPYPSSVLLSHAKETTHSLCGSSTANSTASWQCPFLQPRSTSHHGSLSFYAPETQSGLRRFPSNSSQRRIPWSL